MVALLGVVLLSVLIYLNPYQFFRPQINMTKEQVEESINRSLPKTSVKSKVEEYLKIEKMRYFAFGNKDPVDDIGPSIAEVARVTAPIQSWIRAEIPDAQVAFLIHSYIYVYFFFDENDRLLGHFVTIKHYGL